MLSFQASTQASLGFVTNQWKSSGDLELTGNLAAEWFAYCKALIIRGFNFI
jgi:hypothetical protein